MNIKYFNRQTKKIEEELVYGGAMVNWLYKSSPGKIFSHILCKAPLSQIYGVIQNLPMSAKKIPEFIQKFNIRIDDYLPEEGRSTNSPYSSFNNFFIRKFKPGLRNFIDDKNQLGAFAEARYFGYSSIGSDETVPVKGENLSSVGLINNSKWNNVFSNGPLLLARLCPVDYHRYHFPDTGIVLDDYRIPGLFHSVNPVALKEKGDIFITNERHVTILQTENFGKIAYIEVGAICVGKIVQSLNWKQNSSFQKGDEKGYFLFGGSTVIIIGEKDLWKPSQDILDNTKAGIETYLTLGASVATNGK